MSKRFFSTLCLIFSLTLVFGQDLDRNVNQRLSQYFKEYTTTNLDLGACKLLSTKIDHQKKSLDIFADARCDEFCYGSRASL